VNQIKVQVKLAGEDTILEVPEGTSVSALPDLLDPKWRENVLILINGKVADTRDLIRSSDCVLILPLLAGG
jgi:hypothetical protein